MDRMSDTPRPLSWRIRRNRQRSPLRLSSLLVIAVTLLSQLVTGYQVNIDQNDELRQTCSGMWAAKDTAIDLLFFANSSGTVATVFYEWSEIGHLGVASSQQDVFGGYLKTYICTSSAVAQGACTQAQLGNFIISGDAPTVQAQSMSFGDGLAQDQTITYAVNKTGYYCVGATAVPLTTSNERAAFNARVIFRNAFKGELPGGEYPKLGFYFGLTCMYILVGSVWGYLCVKHKSELLTVQHFISGLLAILVIEQLITWVYYRYLNSHAIDFWHLASINGNGAVTWAARALLVLESLIDSARNSASFFLLLIISMGYALVRPSLDPKTMLRVKVLTGIHLICGCLYSVGIVLISIDSGGMWIFFCIFPLAFTLTAFLLWTLSSLNATIGHLTARKQMFKLSFFTRLYRILLVAVIVIFAFFVVSTIAFSQSGAESFPSQTWRWRWFLLDGWTASLYFVVFCAIAYTWRPTGQNLRLSMSDEIATGENADDDIEMGGQFAGGPAHPDDDSDDEDEDGAAKKRKAAAATAAAGAGDGSSTGANGSSQPPPPAYSREGRQEDDDGEVMFSVGDDDEDASTGSAKRHRETEGLGRQHANDSQATLMGRRGDDE